MVRTIWDDKDFGKQLADCSFLDNNVRRIINQEPDYQKRIQAIFNYVQANMNWNGNFGFFTETVSKKHPRPEPETSEISICC
ncbi:hypothetical protein [Flavobacterium silvaticum]|uniref:Uncharacterized protein n=1 Tax=Flavobacterium silvaticum TaxID=1852020 RepID=A0A972FJK4_9FLAO|nr:hypothetical protein [Flavobacterium silvaticum]NMH27249.1 hypothetical protein [Flavobacterium silvaticum]